MHKMTDRIELAKKNCKSRAFSPKTSTKNTIQMHREAFYFFSTNSIWQSNEWGLERKVSRKTFCDSSLITAR